MGHSAHIQKSIYDCSSMLVKRPNKSLLAREWHGHLYKRASLSSKNAVVLSLIEICPIGSGEKYY